MRNGGKKHNSIKYNAGLGALVALLACAPLPTLAADDPFDIEGGHWMSFDHYKDADTRGMLPPKPVEAADIPSGDATGPAAPAMAAPTVAAPRRPIDLPVMPGLNKGFNVQVNSTVEDQPLPAVTGDVEKTAPVSDKNWQSPASVQTAKKADDDSAEDVPLNVRLSYLPDHKVTPIASPDRESALKAGHIALEKMLAAKAAAPKTPAETAACAAIDNYKKQQLAAIQSDRQTLKALQDAIHSLGLDKQLDFMQGGNNSALNITDKQDAPTSVR